MKYLKSYEEIDLTKYFTFFTKGDHVKYKDPRKGCENDFFIIESIDINPTDVQTGYVTNLITNKTEWHQFFIFEIVKDIEEMNIMLDTNKYNL